MALTTATASSSQFHRTYPFPSVSFGVKNSAVDTEPQMMPKEEQLIMANNIL
jgi:hypothetical protein